MIPFNNPYTSKGAQTKIKKVFNRNFFAGNGYYTKKSQTSI